MNYRHSGQFYISYTLQNLGVADQDMLYLVCDLQALRVCVFI